MTYDISSLRLVEACQAEPGSLLGITNETGPMLPVLIVKVADTGELCGVALSGPNAFNLYSLVGKRGIARKLEDPRIELSDEMASERSWCGTLIVGHTGPWLVVKKPFSAGFDQTRYVNLTDWTLHGDHGSGAIRYFDNWSLVEGPRETPHTVFRVSAT